VDEEEEVDDRGAGLDDARMVEDEEDDMDSSDESSWSDGSCSNTSCVEVLL
jgi:hypothetical protein